MIDLAVSLILMLIDMALISYVIYILNENEDKSKMLKFIIMTYIPLCYKAIINVDGANTNAFETILFGLLPLVVITLSIKYIYNKSFVTAMTATIIYSIYTILIQTIFASILYAIQTIGLKTDNDSFSRIVQILYMITTLILVRLYKCKITRSLNAIISYIKNKTAQKAKSMKLTASIILIALLVSVCTYASIVGNINSKSFVILLAAVALVIFIIVISYYETMMHSYKMKQAEERAVLDNIHQDFIRTINNFGHSYNNMMQTISFFVNCEEISVQELREVLNDIIKWNSENKINYKLKYINIPNIIIASLLSIKLDYAEKLGVVFDVKSEGKAPVDINNSKDFIDMWDILLNNAIEVAHFADNKVVRIKLGFTEQEFNMTITNNFKRDIDGNIMKYGNSKHIGLKTIDDIVSRNTNIIVDKEMSDNEFTIKVTIKSMGDR